MRNDAAFEEGRNPSLGQIDKLVRKNDVTGLQRFLQAAHCAHRDDTPDAERFQCIDVCTIIDFRGIESMTTSVPGQERYLNAIQVSEHDDIGWWSERCPNPHLLDLVQAFDIVQSATAYDPDVRTSRASRSGHTPLPSLCDDASAPGCSSSAVKN